MPRYREAFATADDEAIPRGVPSGLPNPDSHPERSPRATCAMAMPRALAWILRCAQDDNPERVERETTLADCATLHLHDCIRLRRLRRGDRDLLRGDPVVAGDRRRTVFAEVAHEILELDNVRVLEALVEPGNRVVDD